MVSERIVIVGGGLAGAGAAAELRERGFDGDVELVGAEPHPPYIRPPLSKGYLAGDDERGSFEVHPLGWYAEHGIRFVPGSTAVSLDRAARLVGLAGGDALHYDRLLLATGSTPNPLPVPGGGLAGVHLLRTIDQADALHAALAGGGRRVVLIGSGWIGMEVAATARTLGNEVAVLMRGEVPLASQLGAELGGDFARLHEEHGVVLRRGVTVREVLGTGVVVTGVLLDGGEVVPADVVVAAVGAAPAVSLAEAAGLATGDGVHVDARLRTDDERIWAAGDIANAVHPLLEAAGLPARIRSEHWANAEKGGPHAARSMLGDETPYDAIPYFYTDQFDLGMEYTGFPRLAAEGEVVIRGDRAGREFIAFWVRGGAVVAGMNVNVWDVADAVERLVRAGFAGATVDVARLADPDVPLEEL
ncbi:NAD(P)/FAD-dependent oxidoreductase [Protaetiibacter intestinalis]|uniref:NAD(P)/FAD-dependent oxidoreductase n=1 Tax=Protaetiibacter intestinalis TaxID=2419774 RepID=A0A387BFW3_9MICO|nr:FAD-dependent oxidoreductase [Protaetiibacter intestinalis]AYF97400.1 NAD(P)/FAD-dependent oxidoreductase [Protaetiibacter intestinalis]